jgi:transcription antitermination factor NusG
MKVDALDKVKRWHVIYTKSKWEKKVEGLLLNANIESWCPVQKKERQWSDRKKIIEEPLFRSYVFVKIEEKSDKCVESEIGFIACKCDEG